MPNKDSIGQIGQTHRLANAVVTMSAGTRQTDDLLNFNNQNNISGSCSNGVLTGIASVADYETASQSVTFSTTSTITTAREISIVAYDNLLTSDLALETVDVAV